jgi:hypothetical protein
VGRSLEATWPATGVALANTASATDIKVHAPRGFKRRKAIVRIAKPNFAFAFMVPSLIVAARFSPLF